MPVTKMEQVEKEDFIALFPDDMHAALRVALTPEHISGATCYTNLQMDSSHYGERTAMVFGPTCTYKDPVSMAEGHLGDLPSQCKYPTHYYKKP